MERHSGQRRGGCGITTVLVLLGRRLPLRQLLKRGVSATMIKQIFHHGQPTGTRRRIRGIR